MRRARNSPNPTDPAHAGEAWAAPHGELRTGSLAVRVLGQGPPTLLLHGLLGSNRYWGRTYDQLAEDSLLLAPDLLGFGASPRPSSGYGPQEHGNALRCSLRELAVPGNVTVIGHSLGALLALWLAGKHPDQVRRVVAFAPPLYRSPQHARHQMRQMSLMQQLFAFENRAAKLACRNLCQKRPELAAKLFSMVRPHVPYPLLEDATRHSWASYSETVRRVILAAESVQWLASARCEVLLIAGTADSYLDLDFLRELSNQHSQVHLRIWPGEGHDPPLTQPERCMSTIRNWTDTGEQTGQPAADGYPIRKRLASQG